MIEENKNGHARETRNKIQLPDFIFSLFYFFHS